MHTREARTVEFPTGKLVKWGAYALGVICLITLWLGIFTTAEYERGIVTRQGAFLRVAQPGLNFKMPWVDGLEEIDMRVRSPKFENMEAYSSDQQIAKIDISVTLQPRESKLQTLYSNHRTVESAVDALLKPYIPTHTKIVFGDYTAVSAIQNREKLNADIKERIITSLGDSVFDIVSVNVEDIEYSKNYNQSVEERMKSQVEVEKLKQELEKKRVEAVIIKTQADAEAYRIKTQGDAEAAAIEARSKALMANPKLIEYMQAEKWDGKLPTTVLPTTAVPLINQRPN